VHHYQILTVSLDHQSTFVDCPTWKNENPIHVFVHVTTYYF